MKVKHGLVLLWLMSVMLVSACGSSAPAASVGSDGEPAAKQGSDVSKTDGKTYTMRFATATTNDPQTHEMELFKKAAEAKSNGQLKVELYPASQLGSNDQMLQMLTQGSIQGMVQPTAFLGGFNELMTIVDIPYLWPDVQKATEFLNGEGGKLFEASLDKQGITALRYYEYGPRTILLKDKVEKMEDLKGKKIRVMGAPVLVDQINAWGGAGVAMGVPELFTALQQGTIDGLESAASFFHSGKYYESAKYLLMEPKGAEISIFMANTNWLNSLPEHLQKAVKEAAVEITDEAHQYAKERDLQSIEEMKKEGVTVIEPGAEFHQQLVEASKPIISKFEARVPGSKEIISKIQAQFKTN
ncbi:MULTISPECIES: TRAP transporter substrate-binding protein [Paenibacillus]|nr:MULTISPECIES: TRAP transporter substrate-binding protein [Paenibacillus]